MELSEVKRSLNKMVSYSDDDMKNKQYLLTACIIRKDVNTSEYFYQAELQDIKNQNSIMICDLFKIKEFDCEKKR